MLTHRQGFFVLDRAFALIEGHPRYGEATKIKRSMGHPSRGEHPQEFSDYKSMALCLVPRAF